MTTKQEWRPISGYEGRYDISNDGEVRSWLQRGRHERSTEARILAQTVTPKGYRLVHLRSSASKGKSYSVHRLVLLAFVGPCPEGMEASHLNGDSADNRIENLAWESSKKNHARKKLHGTYQTGEKVNSAKLDWEKVRAIRAAHKKIKATELAAMYHVHVATIHRVQAMDHWNERTEASDGTR